MYIDFTFLLISYFYPISQQFQLLSRKDFFVEADVAYLLQKTEQQVSKRILENVYAYASAESV